MVRGRQVNQSRAVAYLRVSTEEQALGAPAQKEAIRRWAKASGVEVVSWHTDQGVSGAAPLDKRPALLDALESLAQSGAGLLVVAKRDRLARDVMVAGFIELQARRRGARVVSAAGEGTEGDDPTAQLMRTIVDAFAEYERGIIRARTAAALAVKRSRGELTGKCPFGMRVGKDGKTLEPEPGEQAVIARALRLSKKLSIRAVAAKLAAEGHRGRKGLPISKGTVEAILKRANA